MGNDDLRKQIEAARAAQAAKTASRERENASASGMALGFRLATEFVAGTLVGAAIGWGLDLVFGTKPWMFVVWLLLGFVAGIFNVVRAANAARLETEAGSGDAPGDGDEGGS